MLKITFSNLNLPGLSVSWSVGNLFPSAPISVQQNKQSGPYMLSPDRSLELYITLKILSGLQTMATTLHLIWHNATSSFQCEDCADWQSAGDQFTHNPSGAAIHLSSTDGILITASATPPDDSFSALTSNI